MRYRIFVIASAGILLAGAVLAAWSVLDSRASAFTGEMRLVAGRAQRVAVSAPAPAGAPSDGVNGSIQRGTSGAVLAQHDPVFSRNWIDPDSTYDIVELPFALAVDDIEVLSHPKPSSRLEVTAPEGNAMHELTEGGAIEIDGQNYRVEAIRPWAGLLRRSGGTPAVDLSVRQTGGAWTEHQFIESGGLLRLGPSLGLYHLRLASRTEVADASMAFPPGLAPRWGVVEGAATNWMGSMTPGTELALSDGRTVRFLETRRSATGESAIRISLSDGQEDASHWVQANLPPEDGVPFCYEDPSGLNCVFAVYTWRDDAATVVAYRAGAPAGQVQLTPGEAWALDACGFELRLDAVVGSALVVPADGSPLQEAVLEAPAGRLRLRQGERLRVGDVSVVFLYESPPPVLRHTLAFYDLDAAELAHMTLEPGGEVRFRGWAFAQGASDPHAPEAAVLTVAPHRSPIPSAAGAALAFAGVCGLWLSRRARVVPLRP
jgi:hypothetical protein